MRNWVLAVAGMGCALFLAGCPKGNQDYSDAKKAEALQDYDTALIHYEKALKSDPRNTEYKIKATRLRFEAGQYHVHQGEKDRAKGDLPLALAEFQKAMAIDPSSAIAEQEVRQTLELIASKRAADECPINADEDCFSDDCCGWNRCWDRGGRDTGSHKPSARQADHHTGTGPEHRTEYSGTFAGPGAGVAAGTARPILLVLCGP